VHLRLLYVSLAAIAAVPHAVLLADAGPEQLERRLRRDPRDLVKRDALELGDAPRDLARRARLVAALDGLARRPPLLLDRRGHVARFGLGVRGVVDQVAEEGVRSVRRADRAPGAVGLEEDAVERQRAHRVEVRRRLERAAVDADEEPGGNELERLVGLARERVGDASERLAVRAQGGDEVGVAGSRVEEEGEAVLRGQLELRREGSARAPEVEDIKSVQLIVRKTCRRAGEEGAARRT